VSLSYRRIAQIARDLPLADNMNEEHY
jgi:hypothetical protein